MNRLLEYVAIHHYRLLNAIIRLVVHTLYKKVTPASHPLNILIVRKGTLGDHLCSLPAINSLKEKFRPASFDLLTYSAGQPDIGIQALVPGNYFHHIYDLDKSDPRKLLELIKKQKYDAVIELPQNLDTFYTQLRNLIFYRLAGINTGAGWAVSNTLFLKKYQMRAIHFENEQERLQKILLSYGIETGIDTNLREQLNTSDEIAIPFDFYIVVAVGAKHQAKKWPVSYFRKLVFKLIEQGNKVVLLGNTLDRDQTENWQNDHLINLCGRTTIPQSAYLIRHALLTVCNDSGPMHLSYHSGVPVVAIFSARGYKGKWFPPDNGRNKVLGRFDVPCAACLLSNCNHHICMEQVSVEEVLNSIDEVLNHSS